MSERQSKSRDWASPALLQPKVGQLLGELLGEAELGQRMQTEHAGTGSSQWCRTSLNPPIHSRRSSGLHGSFWVRGSSGGAAVPKWCQSSLGWACCHAMQLPVDLAVMAAWRAGAGMGQRLERRSSSEGKKHQEKEAEGKKHTQNLG